MLKFSTYLLTIILAASLLSCSRQAAINHYIAAGMPPELVNNGIMIIATPAPNAPVQNANLSPSN